MKAYRLLIFVVLSTGLLLSACASTEVVKTVDVAVDKDNYGIAAEGARQEAPQVSPGLVSDEAMGSGSLDGTSNSMERMVIMNASLSIVVDDPAASMDIITRMASEMGGYVVGSHLYMANYQGIESPEAVVTIRVPAERLTEAMSRVKGMVKDAKLDIRNEVVSGTDVTQEYTDLASRLRNLEATETQLLEIQKAATTTEEIMMVFNQITQVRENIEVIKGQMQYYEESARLSSISVTLVASIKVEPITVAGWQPEGIAGAALQALVDAGKWLVEQLIWLVLYVLPIALVIGIPLFFIIRAYRRRARKAASARQVLPPAQPQQ
jgi:hypothetical protein